MRGLRFGSLALGLLVIACVVKADTITGGGSFFSGGAAPNEGGSTYWDNHSNDGAHKNVGYFLTGTGAFAGSGSWVSSLSWLGATYATPLQSLAFTPSGTNELLRVLGNFSGNSVEFGYYDANSATPQSTLVALVSTDGAGGATGFTTTFKSTYASYGFYLRYTNKVGSVFVPSPADLYMSQTSKSGGNSSSEVANPGISGVGTFGPHQHFTVFATGNPRSNIIAVTDAWGYYTGENGGDYQDLVISITDLPEPATFGFIGLGLAALAVLRRRRG